MGKQHGKPQKSRPGPRVGGRITGKVKRNADGFGFLIPDDIEHPDVYLPRHTMGGVMTNDQVEVKTKRESDGRYSGEITGIVKRAMAQAVGRFRADGLRGGGVILD